MHIEKYRLCTKHRKMASIIPEEASLGQFSNYTVATNDTEFIVDDSRESINRILSQVSMSPIRSQARKRLDQHSESGLRRLTSKLTKAVRVIQSM